AKSSRTEMFWQRRSDKAMRVGQMKWLESAKGGGLYDLATDPGETRDLTLDQPAVAAEMKARFEQWRVEMDQTESRGPFRDF
ncbi:MAG: N-acetylgalactosamine-6-sulfatase, partial [Verrucomicrobiales bacterium]